jgi:hypothetical protein
VTAVTVFAVLPGSFRISWIDMGDNPIVRAAAISDPLMKSPELNLIENNNGADPGKNGPAV